MKIAFLTLLFSVFCSLCLSSSTYAVSDLTGSISFDYNNPSVLTPYNICEQDDCSSYRYLIISYDLDFNLPSNPRGFSSYVSFAFRNFSNQIIQTLNFNMLYSPQIYDVSYLLTNSTFSYIVVGSGSNVSSSYDSGTLYWTLTESYNNCPEPEEPEPCPVVPDNPYDQKFDNVVQAIYVCGAILLVIYFFYCIYRMIIRTTGGV